MRYKIVEVAVGATTCQQHSAEVLLSSSQVSKSIRIIICLNICMCKWVLFIPKGARRRNALSKVLTIEVQIGVKQDTNESFAAFSTHTTAAKDVSVYISSKVK